MGEGVIYTIKRFSIKSVISWKYVKYRYMDRSSDLTRVTICNILHTHNTHQLIYNVREIQMYSTKIIVDYKTKKNCFVYFTSLHYKHKIMLAFKMVIMQVSKY